MNDIQKLMEDFDPKASEQDRDYKYGRPVTVWLSAEDKARYDRIQKMSGRRFSKKLREVLKAALDVAEEKAG